MATQIEPIRIFERTPAPAEPRKPVKRPLGSAFDLIFGIILPALTILFELMTGACAQSFFNPIATPWQLVLACMVPVGNALVWWHLGGPRFRAFANGVALLASLLFCVYFAPLVPMAILGLIVLIGIFPLAPFFAFAVSLRQTRELGWLSLTWAPFAALVIVAVHVPSLVTTLGMDWAVSADAAAQHRGLWLLRNFGDRSQIRDLGEGRRRSVADWAVSSVNPGEARLIYYRVTGQAWETAPRPAMRTRSFDDQWEFDENVGTARVGKVLKGLSLASSAMDGSVDPKAGIGYLEWTMEFRNASFRPNEARATIDLPAGGVVSRATLWINGEEKEAAIGTRSATKQAYQSVVSVRRDPLLVTTAGDGRVMVQCFPVPPNGSMKIKLGISAPADTREWSLPRFAERNFATGQLKHAVWVDAGATTVRVSLLDKQLFTPLALASVSPVAVAWTPDPADPKRFYIQQRRVSRPAPRYRSLAIVVDGSESMRPHAAEVSRLLRGRDVVLAADEVRSSRDLHSSDFTGGADNVPALIAARESVPGDGAVLWIHGPQPVELSAAEGLKQFWNRRPGQAPVYSLQVAEGANVIHSALDGQREFRRLEGSIEAALRKLEGGGAEMVAERERKSGRAGEGLQTSAHLARLWANEEVLRTGDSALAQKYRLVTPFSGAVVLETAQQYEAAGLKAPAGASTLVPTVPEPETWALMLVATGMVVFMVHRRRRVCR
ncbi:MAG: VIT domain-containing protein [Bryobacteraceae bacterium]